jgi:hypothetical protein
MTVGGRADSNSDLVPYGLINPARSTRASAHQQRHPRAGTPDQRRDRENLWPSPNIFGAVHLANEAC